MSEASGTNETSGASGPNGGQGTSDGRERTNGQRDGGVGVGGERDADDDAEADASQRGIDRSPTPFGASLSLLAGLFSVLGSGLGVLTAAAPGAVGLVVLGAGLYRGSRGAVTGGVVVLLGGVLFAGLGGGPPAGLLLGALGALLAWDYGENAITMGEQMGRAADTRRAELVHAAASLGVGVVGSGVVYGVYLGASGGQPVTALVFLLLGVVLLAGVLSD